MSPRSHGGVGGGWGLGKESGKALEEIRTLLCCSGRAPPPLSLSTSLSAFVSSGSTDGDDKAAAQRDASPPPPPISLFSRWKGPEEGGRCIYFPLRKFPRHSSIRISNRGQRNSPQRRREVQLDARLPPPPPKKNTTRVQCCQTLLSKMRNAQNTHLFLTFCNRFFLLSTFSFIVKSRLPSKVRNVQSDYRVKTGQARAIAPHLAALLAFVRLFVCLFVFLSPG